MVEPLISPLPYSQGDYVLVFRNPEYTESEPKIYRSKQYSGEIIRKYLDSLFHISDHTESFAHRKLMDFSILNKESEISYKEYCKRVISSVLKILQEYLGIEVSASLSSDNDEIFLILRTSEENLKVQADLIDYKLQLNQTDIEIENPDCPFILTLPYAPFEKSATTIQKNPEVLYKRYNQNGDEHPEGVTLFRHNDRVRLINSMVHSAITMSLLVKQQILIKEFPLHDDSKLNVLKKEWATFNRVFVSQPYELIRQYFGEELTLYFAWLGFYIKWLIAPSIIGSIVAVLFYVGSVTNDDGIISDVALIAFSFMITISTTFMDKFWTQKEKELALIWGVHDYEKIEQQRPSFKGKYSKDIISGKRKRVYVPEGIHKYAKLLGYGLIVLFIGLVVASLGAVFIVSNSLKYGSFIGPIGVINAIQIKILNYVTNI